MTKLLADLITPEEEEGEFNPRYPVRNYDKMETCQHLHFTLKVNAGKILFKCKCTLTLSENNGLDEVVNILLREQARQVKVREFTL